MIRYIDRYIYSVDMYIKYEITDNQLRKLINFLELNFE